MATSVNNMIHWLTGKSSLQDVSITELQAIAERNPSSMLPQLLLAEKMKATEDASWNAQIQKTAIYTQNTQWLHFLLNNPNLQQQKPEQAVVSEAIDQQTEASQTIISTLIIKEEEEHISETEEVELAIAMPTTEETSDIIVDSTESDEVAREILVSEPTEQSTVETIDNPYITYAASDIIPESKEEEEKKEDDALASRLSKLLQTQIENYKKEEVVSEKNLLDKAVPAFTKDYFKAQGIKLADNEGGELTGKVRRFTDWIKQMKRINANPIDLGSNEEEEQKIKVDAEKSNRKEEVVTEAMLEVLIKQNKITEAISLLEKLSLQKPEKSAFFAHLLTLLKQEKS